eukprot:scaffold154465_cov21-Tisochrysis_lutea.AAC.1
MAMGAPRARPEGGFASLPECTGEGPAEEALDLAKTEPPVEEGRNSSELRRSWGSASSSVALGLEGTNGGQCINECMRQDGRRRLGHTRTALESTNNGMHTMNECSL